MFKNIKISIAVLQTSATIIIRNIRILLVPFLCFGCIVGFIYGWFYSFGHLISCANIIQPTGNA